VRCGGSTADARRLFLHEFHDESLIERAKQLRPSGTVAFLPAESELLPSNVPAGMGNLPLKEKAFPSLPDKVKNRFFRADRSAGYPCRSPRSELA